MSPWPPILEELFGCLVSVASGQGPAECPRVHAARGEVVFVVWKQWELGRSADRGPGTASTRPYSALEIQRQVG